MSKPTTEEYCHDRLGPRFQEALSEYDTGRRVQVIVDDFLTDDLIRGKRVLDVGCGLGFFSRRLRERGADVVACDIGPGLVAATRTRAGCRAEVVDALALSDFFGQAVFDAVVSSECIEHTRDPAEAVRQMARVLKPGGYLSLSTPNRVWHPAVKLATLVHARPFDGFEHFSSWGGMERMLSVNGIRCVRRYGLHLLPFQLRCFRFLTWCDEHLQSLQGVMINICVLGIREA